MSDTLRKPAALLPLRLEIRHIQHSGVNGNVHLAKYVYDDKYDSNNNVVALGHRRKESTKSTFSPVREIWIRWYPDDCQVFPRVSAITETEKDAYESYVSTVANAGTEEEIEVAWKTFIETVGLQRARFLVDVEGEDPNFDEDDAFVEPDKRPQDALAQFLAAGSKLKALPRKIKLYTIHEDTASSTREIKFLAEGSQIPDDIVFSSFDIPGSRWTLDFEKAVAQGMGTKIRDADKCEQVEKADWLVAVGVTEHESAILEELFLRFKALGRFGIVRQDTPTNNTEASKTDFIGLESGTSRQKDIADPRFQDDPPPYLCNEDAVSIHLGLGRHVFRGLDNAYLGEQVAARAMNRILWDACTRAYRDHLMNYRFEDEVYKMKDHPETWRALSEHFGEHVLGRGVTPALLIGDNPYGIVIATDLEEWKSSADVAEKRNLEMNVAKTCKVFREKFLKLADESPHIDLAAPTDVYETLQQILRQHAVSYRVDVQIVNEMDSQLADHGFGKDPRILSCPLVTGKESDEEQFEEIISYLEMTREYLEGTLDPAEWQLPTSEDPDIPLFQRLLQYTADQLRRDLEGDDQPIFSREEIIGAIDTFLRLLDERKVTIEDLEVLLMETLDCLCHRLDAWVTSLSSLHLKKLRTSSVVLDMDSEQNLNADDLRERLPKRASYNDGLKKLSYLGIMTEEEKNEIADMFEELINKERVEDLFQQSQAMTVKVGVYGWLEKPGASTMRSKSDGFFQSPSLNQGAAGAILRSAALSESGNGNKPFQINMSSRRVQKAVWFTEALRKGYSSAELLGQETERQLHVRGLDRYLLDLRKKYPLSGHTEIEQIKNSRVIDGEKFLDGRDDSDIISRADVPEIDAIRSEVRQVRDSVADLFLAEALNKFVQSDSPGAAAWMDAIEGKNVPPLPEVMKTPRSGHMQVQRVLFPLGLNWDTLDLNAMDNPRSIAEPAIALFYDDCLTGFDQAVFQATVSSRDDVSSESFSCTISPQNDLNMDTVDLLTGGKAEMEKRARIFLWERLVMQRSLWQIHKDDFDDGNLVQELIEKNILKILKENTDYVYFADRIVNEAKLEVSLSNSGFSNEAKQKVITIWRDTQSWKFLGRDVLKSPRLQDFEDRAYIHFGYSFTEGGSLPLNHFLKRGKSLHLFVQSVNPLKPEDLLRPEESEAPGGIEQQMISQKKEGYLFLKERLLRLLALIGEKRDDLKDLRDELNALGHDDADVENKMYEIQDQLLEIAKYGLPEALVPLPMISSQEVKEGVLSLIDTVLDRMEHQKVKLAEKIDYVLTLKIAGKELKVRITPGGDFESQDDGNPWTSLGDSVEETAIKLWAIEQYIKEAIELLKESTAKDTLTVLTPFKRASAMDVLVPEEIVEEEYKKNLLQYSNVRKNLHLMKNALSAETLKISSDLRIHKSLEQALNEAIVKELSKGTSPDDITPDSIDVPTPWLRSGVDIHYLLRNGDLHIPANRGITGFKVDEWTDFIPNTTETTALAFQYETPQAEAPQALLLAVPPIIDSSPWTDSGLVEIIADTLDLMRIRMVFSEAVVGSNLGSLLPGALFAHSKGSPGRFPSYELPLFDGIIKGGFYYVSADQAPESTDGRSARRGQDAV